MKHGNGDFMIGGAVWPGLSKLIEECGEVLQVGGKLMGSAGDTAHWSGDLNQMLIEELGDLLAAVGFFMDVNGLDVDAVLARSTTKLALFEKWHAETQIDPDPKEPRPQDGPRWKNRARPVGERS